MENTKEQAAESDLNEKDIVDENVQTDDSTVNKLYMKEFDSLPVMLQLGNLALRDMSLLPSTEKYHQSFIESFFGDFEDNLQFLESDWEVKGSIESSCHYIDSFPSWLFDASEYIYQKFSEAEDDEELSETEFLKKYASKVKGILSDYETILTVYAKSYQFHFGSDISISFIASAIVSELRLNWEPWAKWQEAIKEV